jgi:hypothetical protein
MCVVQTDDWDREKLTIDAKIAKHTRAAKEYDQQAANAEGDAKLFHQDNAALAREMKDEAEYDLIRHEENVALWNREETARKRLIDEVFANKERLEEQLRDARSVHAAALSVLDTAQRVTGVDPNQQKDEVQSAESLQSRLNAAQQAHDKAHFAVLAAEARKREAQEDLEKIQREARAREHELSKQELTKAQAYRDILQTEESRHREKCQGIQTLIDAKTQEIHQTIADIDAIGIPAEFADMFSLSPAHADQNFVRSKIMD